MLAEMSTDLALALDPAAMARAARFEPDPWQEDLLRCAEREVILNCSRQSGKSSTVSFLALHEAIYAAPALTLVLAPALRQAKEFFRKVRDGYASLKNEGVPVPAVAELSVLRVEFDNGSRIECVPGKADTIRGFSGTNLLIVDEAAWVSDALYYAIRPMLAVSGGRIFLLSTPFGKRGFFFEVWERGDSSWKRLEIPAAMCPRITEEFLAAERRQLPSWVYDQEYNCRFAATLDSVFRYEDIEAALVDDDDEQLDDAELLEGWAA
jgi:hypothetical protein